MITGGAGLLPFREPEEAFCLTETAGVMHAKCVTLQMADLAVPRNWIGVGPRGVI